VAISKFKNLSRVLVAASFSLRQILRIFIFENIRRLKVLRLPKNNFVKNSLTNYTGKSDFLNLGIKLSPMEGKKGGILYVVALPIGNLKDITLRGLEVLREVDLVLTEDTRSFKKLERAYRLPKKELISFYKEVEAEKEEKILRLLKEGSKIALCSEAGTPLLSDPGARLVKRAHLEGIQVEPIPGASALTASLSVSGLNLSKGFIFLGFLPRKEGEIKESLKGLPEDLPLVLFVPPHRFSKTLQILLKILGDRRVFLARELTKFHQELTFSTLSELSQREDLKGEITLIIEGRKEETSAPREPDLRLEVKTLLQEGLKIKEIARRLSIKYRRSAKELYRLIRDIKD
jgi:16S rRNA (cytidine1402-2'-O)-methyltransferase